jgi:RNA polymerase sigma-70 factor (ECF subfamily)
LVDLKLIEECRSGNLNNFRKVVEASTPLAFSVAFRMLGDEDLAKDVVQEALVTIWQKIANINSPEGYKTWLCRIVINKCYDEMRRKKRNPEYSQDDGSWAKLADRIEDNTLEGLANNEIAVIITGLTERLSPKQKAVFILSDLEEMTHNEVAHITGMNKLTVKANLYYARKSIRTMLQKYL